MYTVNYYYWRMSLHIIVWGYHGGLSENTLICSLRMYNSLVEKCFKECVDGFRRKDLDATEERVRLCILKEEVLSL